MKWNAPPDRREITLLLFSLAVFTISYNLDNSIRLLGLDPVATQGAVLNRLGLGGKAPGWRDALETDMPVAGDGAERTQLKGSGRHGAIWKGKADIVHKPIDASEGKTVGEAIKWWRDGIPQTTLMKHAPGYTVLDNVFLFNKTVYIVTDKPESLPPLSSIVATTVPGLNTWQIISTGEAMETIGSYGGVVGGVTWMSADISPQNSTLFALWRTYSSLDTSIDAQGRTTLSPPRRIFFPHTRVFSDPRPPFSKHWIRRVRADVGFHPWLAKAAFPHLTSLFMEDWEDYHLMEVPFLMERIVVADTRAAAKSIHLGQPPFSPPFELDVSEHWWEPIRRTLTSYLDIDEASSKKVITYLHRQGEGSGPTLEDANHEALVNALKKMETDFGYEVNVLSNSQSEWHVKMTAITRSSIVVGVHGGHLFDAVFMKPTPQTTLMELFPTDTFARDNELAIHSLGMHYIAWWDNQKFTSDDLPAVATSGNQVVKVNPDAIVQSIHETLSPIV
ncbi:hypothetical protein BD779DRAFT_1527080 [Infundibulicybe gibba]|nr:hypothetical protein BD779DRAFT_1527080 [Infundibulicybe gibba]